MWATTTQWGWTARAADVARVATPQGLPVSAETVWRALRAAPDPPVGDVRVVGLDAGALRQGRTDAAIVVDPERPPGVDVWPDDQPETVAAWLRAHPTIPMHYPQVPWALSTPRKFFWVAAASSKDLA